MERNFRRRHPAGLTTFSTPDIWTSLFMMAFICAPSRTRISSRMTAKPSSVLREFRPETKVFVLDRAVEMSRSRL